MKAIAGLLAILVWGAVSPRGLGAQGRFPDASQYAVSLVQPHSLNGFSAAKRGGARPPKFRPLVLTGAGSVSVRVHAAARELAQATPARPRLTTGSTQKQAASKTVQKKRAATRKAARKRPPSKRAASAAAAGRAGAQSSAGKAVAPRPTSTAARSAAPRRTVRRSSPWITPTYADSTVGDIIDGEDLEVRRAAVEALGPFNGSVVVADPNSGRLLAVVNQKLAFQESYLPCSTVKLVAGVAALNEELLARGERIRLDQRQRMDLTEALATSNNPFFARIGQKLGFEKVAHYAKLLGAGEQAGLGIDEEKPGFLAASTPAAGMGRMTTFGDGIEFTPLQLTAMMVAFANGGTMYYLQHPKSQAEAAHLVPRVKRRLELGNVIEDLKPGMRGATEFGTARRASYNPSEPIYGKTGTCTDKRTHLGWFGSFNEAGETRLVVTVLLTGGQPANGPTAAEIAGRVYKSLSEKNYFAARPVLSPTALIESSSFAPK